MNQALTSLETAFPQRLAPLYGLILGLLPVCAVFEEYLRLLPLFPLLTGFGLVGLICWYAYREYWLTMRSGGHEGGHTRAQAASLVLAALWVLIGFVLVQVLLGLLYSWPAFGWKAPLALNADAVYYSVYFGLAVALLLIARRIPGRRFDFNLRWRWKPLDIAIALGMGVLTFAGLRIYTSLSPQEVDSMQIFGAVRGVTPDWLYWTAGVGFAVINAFCEEIWFRGLLMGALRNLLPPWKLILLQGLTFGIIHWFGTPERWWGILLAGSWGILLGWWTYKRGSLWPALTVHFLADWLIFAYTNM
ncbi:CPBP family intramembrane metalloprotease [bacterium]|nr:CPBP family intramembrane metalloprotease [bacterium]